ncbi:PAB-dependent poly(A)-specific ribonuclease subunit PAN2 [Bisporella sp. PMI_857]|nr:PAB-dependent poly(A)-specific ribonuclease subunit PAN2 [Bisporella sp. PMI_857]
MDGDWDEVSLTTSASSPPNGYHSPIEALAFDTHQELLWLGNKHGRVSSFYNADLQPYTSFMAGDLPVRQLLFHDKGVIAVTPTSIHMAMRRGPPLWHLTNSDMKNLQCMSYTSRGQSEILVAGGQNVMFVIDVEKGTILRQVSTIDQYTLMKRSRYICAATTTGVVNILDATTFSVIKAWTAHSAAIHDMDAQHDFIVTCGFSRRQQHNNGYMYDLFVNVFNLKTLESFSPIPFPAGAAFVRMHPKMSSTTIVASQIGQMHVVDLMNVNTTSIMKQANIVNSLKGLDIAPSGEAIILSDSDCQAHLWGNHSKLQFTDHSLPIEFADPEEHGPPLDWGVETPLNTIGLPYYRQTLLSAWPNHLISEIGAPPPSIEPNFLSVLKPTGQYTYTQNTRNTRRNQVENTRIIAKASAGINAPMFLSDKENAKMKQSARDASRASESADVAETDPSGRKAGVPDMYGNVEIKYGKFGVDDFDFGYFNGTNYSGLETHISNAYANSLLQIMRFTPLIRNLALHHTATSCINDMCLLCELGFLVDMLEKAGGSPCQATNMLKTFSCQAQAGPLGLLEEDSSGNSLSNMLQGLNRFLLDRFSMDYKSVPPPTPITFDGTNITFDNIFATQATTAIRCEHCRSEHTRSGKTLVNELMYPQPKLGARHPRIPKFSFSQILKMSVERETMSRGWCNRCQKYQYLSTKKAVHSAPAALMLNAAANSPEAKHFWAIPGWLPAEIGIIIEHDQFFCYEGEDLKLHLSRGIHKVAVYSLIGFVADIDNGQHQKSHLVSLVNVSHVQPVAPAESQWHLFNDFLVRPVTPQNALTFNTSWKVPSVITYQLKAACNRIDDAWKQAMDCSLLYRDTSSSAVPGERTYRPLALSEAPGEGTVVALDTEFVSIRQAEIQITSEGESETIRPTVYALARVSILRASGEDEGMPFIDDYIMVRGGIVDYLTNFSGIVAEDLNPRTSRHSLVPLKVVYKKLWILLNKGCLFLGHGLSSDFRVANIHVPKAQRIDTGELFFIKEHKRKLKLAFVAWHVLKEPIQVDTHDSIEDARTALKLYRKYQEYTDAGIWKTMLNSVYASGKDNNFQPPTAAKKDELVIQPSGTPPLHDGRLVDASSGPVTPVRRPIGLAPGTGGSFGTGFTPGRNSPFK